MHAGRSGHVFVFCPARLFVALPATRRRCWRPARRGARSRRPAGKDAGRGTHRRSDARLPRGHRHPHLRVAAGALGCSTVAVGVSCGCRTVASAAPRTRPALPPTAAPEIIAAVAVFFSPHLSSHTHTQPTRTRCACSAVQVDALFAACAGSAVCGYCCGFLAGREEKGRKTHSTRGSAL
ncbi:uncharacterized protein Tco025E_09512 [Trypanosoma conorhini]|uniref:Uncharacterized protein n=1 Tax=Trypanosoma conorhini TaxID=83891 RepID=A0A3R7KC82_9TRYP|nr:uncharacterized protein Tco025E_09512 [Trypanosoma conorhini]RNE97651.1 hypothetical protein Tco025E_09512 [Trypanosoma conorhini]